MLLQTLIMGVKGHVTAAAAERSIDRDKITPQGIVNDGRSDRVASVKRCLVRRYVYAY